MTKGHASCRNSEGDALALADSCARGRVARHARLQAAPERPCTTATKVSNRLRELFRHRAARFRAATDLLMPGSSLYSDDLMATAWRPFSVSSAKFPSCARSTIEMSTKTSLPPPSTSTKPIPFGSLNHLIVPTISIAADKSGALLLDSVRAAVSAGTFAAPPSSIARILLICRPFVLDPPRHLAAFLAQWCLARTPEAS
jgi:hypothetical protein